MLRAKARRRQEEERQQRTKAPREKAHNDPRPAAIGEPHCLRGKPDLLTNERVDRPLWVLS